MDEIASQLLNMTLPHPLSLPLHSDGGGEKWSRQNRMAGCVEGALLEGWEVLDGGEVLALRLWGEAERLEVREGALDLELFIRTQRVEVVGSLRLRDSFPLSSARCSTTSAQSG